MEKKIAGKDPRNSIRLPDFREKEHDLENLYKNEKNELDSFWDGETIKDDKETT